MYNYNPATMSPNPGGEDDELPFREGQVIRVRSSAYCLLIKKGVQNDDFLMMLYFNSILFNVIAIS